MNIKFNEISIRGIAASVPKNKLILENLDSEFGCNEIKRIAMSTGIHSVGVALPDQKAADFCFYAATQLIRELSIDSATIDAIIFVSQTSNYQMPATSCILQHYLKLPKSAIAFDINYGCSGYIYGLYQASLLINSKSCKRVLVCVGDTISKHLHPNDQKVRLVFGDGGTATIVENGDGEIAFNIMTDGSGFQNLIIEKTQDNNAYLHMDGSKIMEFVLREVPSSVDSVISQMKWGKEDVGTYVLHQANQFMLDYLRKKLNIKKQQMPIAIKQYGNTGSASIPLALCHHRDNFNKDFLNKVIFSGFGAGLSWGSVATSLCDTIITNVYEI